MSTLSKQSNPHRWLYLPDPRYTLERAIAIDSRQTGRHWQDIDCADPLPKTTLTPIKHPDDDYDVTPLNRSELIPIPYHPHYVQQITIRRDFFLCTCGKIWRTWFNCTSHYQALAPERRATHHAFRFTPGVINDKHELLPKLQRHAAAKNTSAAALNSLTSAYYRALNDVDLCTHKIVSLNTK